MKEIRLAKEVIIDVGEGRVKIDGEVFERFLADQPFDVETPSSDSFGMVYLPLLVDGCWKVMAAAKVDRVVWEDDGKLQEDHPRRVVAELARASHG